MWHPLLSPSCMATVLLCLLWAASSRADGTGPGGLAPAACRGLPRKMAGSPPLSHALSPQGHRGEAPHAQRGEHEITTNSPGFGDMAPGKGKIKGGPIVAFITELNMRLRRKAEQGTTALVDECCFWNNIMWSFSHHAYRCLPHSLHLFYYGLVLPLCKVTTILVTVITGIQLLVRCTKSCQSWKERKEQWPESPLSMVWGAADCPELAICLEAYKPGEVLKLLSCSHAYHSKCIDLWHCAQPGSKTCPLCLRSVTAVLRMPLRAHSGEQE